jgi:hypothetical protein
MMLPQKDRAHLSVALQLVRAGIGLGAFRTRRKSIYCFLGLLALAVRPLAAGGIFEWEVQELEGGEPRVARIKVQEAALIIEEEESGSSSAGGRMIYRPDHGKAYVVSSGEKEAQVLDRDTFLALAEKSRRFQNLLEEAAQSEDEETRRDAQRHLERQRHRQEQRRAIPASDIRRTEERASIQGYPCTKVEVTRAGAAAYEMWVTDWSGIAAGEELHTALLGYFAFVRKIYKPIWDAMGLTEEPGGFQGGPLALFGQIDGFPVVIKRFEGGELVEEVTLRSAEGREPDPAEFEPPASESAPDSGDSEGAEGTDAEEPDSDAETSDAKSEGESR